MRMIYVHNIVVEITCVFRIQKGSVGIMLKGCQRKIIMLKNTGSNIFEEAYFVIRDSALRSHVSEADMIAEANRIIRENGTAQLSQKKSKKKAVDAALLVRILFALAALVFAVGFLLRVL